MPRRHRRAPEPEPKPISEGVRSLAAPEWAIVDWASVRQVSGQKGYTCPGCQHPIRPGVPHLVVVIEEDLEGRRHWHTECWRRELRRRGHRA